jgi:hypothetical protein
MHQPAAAEVAPASGPPSEARDGASDAQISLFGCLSAGADRAPDAIAFDDQPGRERWVGRPARTWTYAEALEATLKLAGCLADFRLAPGTVVGLYLPAGSELALTMLAVEAAGLVPCLLPLTFGADELATSIDAADIRIAITQAMIGDERPAELMSRVAARHFRLSFLLAFGPEVPDGVVDLDRVLATRTARPLRARPAGPAYEPGFITFPRLPGQGSRARFRTMASLLATARPLLAATGLRSGDRLVTFVAPDDLKGLALGLGAAALAGAALQMHAVFDTAALVATVESPGRMHLVVPGWLEGAVAGAKVSDLLASIVLAHEAPLRFKAATPLGRKVVDAVAFEELALTMTARTFGGLFALKLNQAGENGTALSEDLSVRLERDRTVSFSGLGAATQDVVLGERLTNTSENAWRRSPFRADVFADVVIGVS